MAQVLATPGVYIEEKSAFPSSAVQVATAVPAFVGYTEKALKNRVTSDLSNNLGNLVQRTIKFLFKNFEGVLPFQLNLR